MGGADIYNVVLKESKTKNKKKSPRLRSPGTAVSGRGLGPRPLRLPPPPDRQVHLIAAAPAGEGGATSVITERAFEGLAARPARPAGVQFARAVESHVAQEPVHHELV